MEAYACEVEAANIQRLNDTDRNIFSGRLAALSPSHKIFFSYNAA